MEKNGEKRGGIIAVLLLIIAALVIAAGVIIAGAVTNAKKVKYQAAKSLMEGGCYSEAKELLNEVGAYKDSAELIAECIENQRANEDTPEAEESVYDDRGSSPLFNLGRSVASVTAVGESDEVDGVRAGGRFISVKITVVSGELCFDEASELKGKVLLRDADMKPYVSAKTECAVKLGEEMNIADESTLKCESVTLYFDVPEAVNADELALHVKSGDISERICLLGEIKKA